jgi:hypothetical protein
VSEQGTNDSGEQGGTQQGTGGTGAQGGEQHGTQTGQHGAQSGGGQPGGTGGGEQGGSTGDTKAGIDSLPEWAQEEIRKARREAGDARVNAKRTAAEEAKAAVLAEIGKALGFAKDEKPDPEKLTAQLEELTRRQSAALVENAVLKAAGRVNADAEALLDSRSFVDRVTKLDPAADDFAERIGEEIKRAVKDNPRLSAGTPATRTGGEITGGSGEKSGGGEGWDDIEKLVRRKR